KLAEKFNNRLEVPPFETTPEQLIETTEKAIARSNKILDAIAKADPSTMTFEDGIGALDDMNHANDLDMSRVYLLKNTSESQAMRDTASDMIQKFEQWAVGVDYREDVYRTLKA